MGSRRTQSQVNNSRKDRPRKELSNASLEAAADELWSLANDLNHYNYSDPWLIDRAARLSLGPFGELYCDLHKAKTHRQKEMKSIIYQIMGLLGDISRQRQSKTCAGDLQHWADILTKTISQEVAKTREPIDAAGNKGETKTESAKQNMIKTSEKEEEPDDLITSYIAVKKYVVSRVTLLRAIKDERLKSYRRADALKNSLHFFSEKAIARVWPIRHTGIGPDKNRITD
jgi:hypothetical protein